MAINLSQAKKVLLVGTDGTPYNAASTDNKVAVDSAATAGYLGAAYGAGVLRTDNTTITKTDGGDYITLALDSTLKSNWDGAASHKTTEDAINGLVKCNGAGSYSAITDNSTNWNTAYGWGNHASAGYLTSESDTLSSVSGRGATTSTALEFYANATFGRNGATGALEATITLRDGLNPGSTETITYTKWNSLNDANGIVKSNGSGSFSAITDNSTNWNTAYGWGNHASAGYLTSESDTLSSVSGRGATTSTAVEFYANATLGRNGATGALEGILTLRDGLNPGSTETITYTKWNSLNDANGIVKCNGSGSFSAITDSSANWDTGYNHSQDNSQAHTDYLINNGNDDTSGSLQIKSADGIILGEDVAGGSPNVAGNIKMFSAGDNAYYNTITSGTNSANATYTLPTAMPASDKYLKSTNAGVLSWETVTSATEYGGSPVVVTTWAALKTALETTNAAHIRISGSLTATSDITCPVDATAAGMRRVLIEGIDETAEIDFGNAYQIIISGSTTPYQEFKIRKLGVKNCVSGKGSFSFGTFDASDGQVLIQDIKVTGSGSAGGGYFHFSSWQNQKIVIDGYNDEASTGAMLYVDTDMGDSNLTGYPNVVIRNAKTNTAKIFRASNSTKFLYSALIDTCKFEIGNGSNDLCYKNCIFTNCFIDSSDFNPDCIGNVFIHCQMNGTISWDQAADEWSNTFIDCGKSYINRKFSNNENVFLGTVTAAELVGELVYATGTADTYNQADATDTTKPACAVIVYKPNATLAVMKSSGIMGGYAALTIGGKVYLSETLGGITQTRPTTAGCIIQEVGFAKSATEVLYNITSIQRDYSENHGGMFIYNNGNATPCTQNYWVAVRDFATGAVQNFTFDAGGTGSITDTADNGSGKLRCTDATHGLATGDFITLDMGNVNHNGITKVTKVNDDTFDCDNINYNADDDTGSWYQGGSLTVGASAAGKYLLNGSYSSSVGVANKTYEFGIYINTTLDTKSYSERTYSDTALGVGAFNSILTLAAGDVVWLGIKGTTDGTDLTIKHGNLTLTKI